jgi:hypothetical protein
MRVPSGNCGERSRPPALLFRCPSFAKRRAPCWRPKRPCPRLQADGDELSCRYAPSNGAFRPHKRHHRNGVSKVCGIKSGIHCRFRGLAATKLITTVNEFRGRFQLTAKSGATCLLSTPIWPTKGMSNMRECGVIGEKFRKTITLRSNCRSTRSRILKLTSAPAVLRRALRWGTSIIAIFASGVPPGEGIAGRVMTMFARGRRVFGVSSTTVVKA